MVHIYNGVLLSHKKYWNNVICSNMDGPTDSLSEIVRKRQIYDTAYTESKKKNDINEKVKVAQSCLILCDPLDYSLSGSCAHRILQARILEWVAVPFSRRCSQPRYQTQVSHIAGGFFTIWTTKEAPEMLNPEVVACKAPLTMEFSRQEYWSELPFPSPGDLPNPGIELGSPALAGGFFTIWDTREALQLAAALLCPWNSPGKNTGVGSCSLFQGIFPFQGWNPGLPHRADSLLAEPPGKP